MSMTDVAITWLDSAKAAGAFARAMVAAASDWVEAGDLTIEEVASWRFLPSEALPYKLVLLGGLVLIGERRPKGLDDLDGVFRSAVREELARRMSARSGASR